MINKESAFYKECVEELKEERKKVLEAVSRTEEEKITEIKEAVKSLLSIMKREGEKGISVEYTYDRELKVLELTEGTTKEKKIKCSDIDAFTEMCKLCGMKVREEKSEEGSYWISL